MIDIFIEMIYIYTYVYTCKQNYGDGSSVA